jgi:hypothetical protein
MVEGFWKGSASAIGVDVAPGVDDRDHGLAGVIASVVAHLRCARAVVEGLAVARSVPAVAAQILGALSGHVSFSSA